MNMLLWAIQGVLAALFGIAGGTKVFAFAKVSETVASMRALPSEAWTLIGVFELVCALALVVPGATGKSPNLTPIAAACLAVEGIAFAGLHYSYGAYAPLAASLVLSGLAGFVSYGRFVLKPL